ncbi:MAG: BREX-3 system phosphatase PglZ [Bacillota bacterium]|jgi:hypothetical protein
MSSWREAILRELSLNLSRLYVVADPDGLLFEEGLAQEIRDMGFDILPFDDPVVFRYVYESRYRNNPIYSDTVGRGLIVRCASHDFSELPYDILKSGRNLSFGLAELFPNLSYPVVAELDLGDLEILYRKQEQYKPQMLGDNATRDFVLEHVFRIAPERVSDPADLLLVLLRRHYGGIQFPVSLDQYLIDRLSEKEQLRDWPLEQIIPDGQAFLGFLQERWSIFLDHIAGLDGEFVNEPASSLTLKFSGPAYLPLDDDRICPYIKSLFLDGLLKPIEYDKWELVTDRWVEVGVKTDQEAYHIRRLGGLIESALHSVPSSESAYRDWLAYARRWAELTVLSMEIRDKLDAELLDQLQHLYARVDSEFLEWVCNRYAGLHNCPAFPPVMVHHIPRFLAMQMENGVCDKVALIVVDGMALDQWLVIKDTLEKQRPGYNLEENDVFAWIPTLTSVSRQAIFAGKPPLYFPDSLLSTNEDKAHWVRFWAGCGVAKNRVAYERGLGHDDLELVREIASNPAIRVIGLVINTVDQIMHGMMLGSAGMHNQVRQWAREEYLANLIDILIDHGFHVALTSDHGNIEATGCGSPSERAIADLRGERVRVYPDCRLRDLVKEKFPDAIEWSPMGLHDDFLPLIAPDRSAFVNRDKRIVTHGGISIEELIVPFVQIQRRTS